MIDTRYERQNGAFNDCRHNLIEHRRQELEVLFGHHWVLALLHMYKVQLYNTLWRYCPGLASAECMRASIRHACSDVSVGLIHHKRNLDTTPARSQVRTSPETRQASMSDHILTHARESTACTSRGTCDWYSLQSHSISPTCRKPRPRRRNLLP